MDLILLLTILGIAAGGIVTFGVIRMAQQQERRLRTRMREVVRRLGGQARRPTFLAGPVWELPSEFGDLTITYAYDDQGAQNLAVSLTLAARTALSVTRERKGDLRKLLQGEDLQVGVPRFDGRFRLGGSPSDLRAVLGIEGRRAVHRGVGQLDMTVRGGVVTSLLPMDSEVEDILARCQQVLEFGGVLARALADRSGHLLRHVQTDPVLEVRRACLEQLLRAHGRSAAAETLRSLTLDHVDLRCIVALDAAARDLAALEALLKDPELADDLRHQAVAALGRGHGGGLAVEEGAPGELALEAGALGALSKSKA